MKKILCISLMLILLLCSCSSSDKKLKDTVYPSEILTTEDISPFFDYSFKMEETRSRRVSVAQYLSEPLGNNPVVVKVRQKNGLQNESEVKEIFDENKKMRTDSFETFIRDAEGYIAYPSIHYFIDGYYIEITAGSGSDDTQKALLTNLANISYDRLVELTGAKNSILSESDDTSDKNEDALIVDTEADENNQE